MSEIRFAANELNKLSWRKSSHSGGGNDCVEVAPIVSGAAVRDTKDRAAGALVVSAASWQALIDAV